ncbi:MAG: ATP-binding protein [Saprospiraceae bacterium]|nr:ATP-binding protein [Candidatus Defluviibacterium haderslevense]
MQILETENFTENTLNEIINSCLEESINIEFKSAQALSKDNSVKKEISKDISAFANSDGGLIFYGINEENHIATSVSFIDGNTFTKEWLENVIISNIQPKIIDLKIFPIRFNNDFSQTVYVVKIPNSNSSPHINGDKKYYRRFNFQSVPMEEYEIRNLYLRQRESKVYPETLLVKPDYEHTTDDNYSFYVEIQIVNDGQFVSEKYKVACNISKASGIGISYDRTKNYSVTNKGENGIKISNNDIVPLFPNELFNVLSFTINIPKDYFEEITQRLEFKIFTFSITEMDETTMDLNDLLIKTKKQYYE